jgi:hypothetical protein
MNIGSRRIFLKNSIIDKLKIYNEQKYYTIDEIKNIIIDKYYFRKNRLYLDNNDCEFFGIKPDPASPKKLVRISVLMTLILENFTLNDVKINPYIYSYYDRPININNVNIDFLKH